MTSALAKPLELPWPDRALHPNARVHWSVKMRAARKARRTAATMAMFHGWHRIPWPPGRLRVQIDAWRPYNRAFDHDGVQSSLKPALDGIAEIMKVNDSRFVPMTLVHDDIVPGGRILVEITAMGEEAA